MNNNRVNSTMIAKEIAIDVNHIDNYNFDVGEGTKKLKEKYRSNAIADRNNYIKKRLNVYDTYQTLIFYEMKKRVGDLLPDKNSPNPLADDREKIEELEEYLIDFNLKLPVSFKTGLDPLLDQINDESNLDDLNACLNDFVDTFSSFNIKLSVDDFSYTSFTKMYMTTFFQHRLTSDFLDTMSDSFKQIFYKCPKLILQLKKCLFHIIKKYENELAIVQNLINSSRLVNESKIVDDYVFLKKELIWKTFSDLDSNLELFLSGKLNIDDFLEGSKTRDLYFGKFISEDYFSLNNSDKIKFSDTIREFYGVLCELKQFYRYEPILNDLIAIYKNKDSVLGEYVSKLKEYETLDKLRVKLNAEYDKSIKPNFFGIIKEDKSKLILLKINENFDNLSNAQDNFDIISFKKSFIENCSDVSTVYDLFENSLLSYKFLSAEFIKYFSDDKDFSLDMEFDSYFKFIYGFYNKFLRKSHVFTDPDLASVLADKYKILGLNVSTSDLLVDNIQKTLDMVGFIVRSLSINDCSLDFNLIKFICEFKNIESSMDKYVDSDII